MQRRVLTVRIAMVLALCGLAFLAGVWTQRGPSTLPDRVSVTTPVEPGEAEPVVGKAHVQDDSGDSAVDRAVSESPEWQRARTSGPDQQWFPEVVSGGQAGNRSSARGQTLSEEEQSVWEHSLRDLSAAEATEVLQIRDQLGSVARELFDPGIGARSWSQTDSPRLFPVPQDDSLRPAIPVPEPDSIVLTSASSDSGPAANDRFAALNVVLADTWRGNLLNAVTPGYKRREIVILSSFSAESSDGVEGKADGIRWVSRIDLQPGTLRETGNPLDVAIEGDGFFETDSDEVHRFTRCGMLRIDSNGRLCVQTGLGLLPLSPPILVPKDSSCIEIQTGGAVLARADANSDQVECGTIRIVAFQDPSQLRYLQGSLYAATDESGPATRVEVEEEQRKLRPRYLELSNVDEDDEDRVISAVRRVIRLASEPPDKAAPLPLLE